MKTPYEIGNKIKCINATGELQKGQIYTVRLCSPYEVSLVESSHRHYCYDPARFELYLEKSVKDMSFDEQVAISKGLVGKYVKYNGYNIEVTGVHVFLKGVYNDKISGLIEDVLKTKEWCIGIKSGIQTIPLHSVEITHTYVVKNVGDYEAIVHKDHVMVGCQKISKEKVQEILKAFDSI